ncbi:MAG: DUF4124 domain-containing protein [Zoogloeaceae bacterium]|nr:DUF4124 domain-containing protein [Zoogloeaceae bacterium]
MFVVLATVLANSPATAEVFKWVDEKGVVNYGSAPPPGRSAKPLSSNSGVSVVPAPPPTPTEPSAPPSAVDRRIETLEKALADEKAAREQREDRQAARRRAAIAECEANHGVDCENDPWEYDSTIVPVRRHGILHPPIYRPPSLPKPPAPPKPSRDKDRGETPAAAGAPYRPK